MSDPCRYARPLLLGAIVFHLLALVGATGADEPVRATAKAPVALPRDTFAAKPLRILPLGDSITRGSYMARYEDGPYQGSGIGLPNPDGGGYRKPLQERLRTAGVVFDFVGDLNYRAYGRDGVVDPDFDPDHHGLAGFSNGALLKGGVVPTPRDVLNALKVRQISVPAIDKVLNKHQPDVILLMSGANGFNAVVRDELILAIGEHSRAHLFVATIPPQKAPRRGWERVPDYNASLPAVVEAQKKAGKPVTLVDMYAALSEDDLLSDGVHPSQSGMEKMADVWFDAIVSNTSGARFSLAPSKE